MAQQPGMKRAVKVLARKQKKEKEGRKVNFKQTIYAFEKAMKEAGMSMQPAAQDHSGHDHAGHDHSSHEGHDHGPEGHDHK